MHKFWWRSDTYFQRYDREQTHRHAHHNTPLSYQGQSNYLITITGATGAIRYNNTCSYIFINIIWTKQTNTHARMHACTHAHTHTHTHTFNDPFSGTTQVSRYQKGKTNLDFTEAWDNERQWHQLGYMQVCTLLQTDNHTSTPPLCFYRPDALPAAQPTVSKHWRHRMSEWVSSFLTAHQHIIGYFSAIT